MKIPTFIIYFFVDFLLNFPIIYIYLNSIFSVMHANQCQKQFLFGVISYFLFEVLGCFHDFFVISGVIFLKIYFVLIKKLKPLYEPSIKLAHQKHYLHYFDDATLVGINDLILYVFLLEFKVKLVQFFH